VCDKRVKELLETDFQEVYRLGRYVGMHAEERK
jgi:hypothetical protein